MLPPLQQSTVDFSSWQRQFIAFASIKEWDDTKKLSVLPAFVSEEILVLAPWDGKATLSSAMKKLEKAWFCINRPSNPLENFEKAQFNPNLQVMARELIQAGIYINASDETVLRKFISLLPEPLKMAAFQFSPDLTTTIADVAEHISRLPMPKVYGTASVNDSSTPSSCECTLAAGTRQLDSQSVKAQDASSRSSTATRQFRNSMDRKVICFNCGGENHTSRFCTARASKCGKCGGRHHSDLCDRVRSYRDRSKNAK
jgi:hypothetical protein